MWVHGQIVGDTLEVNPCIPVWLTFLHDNQLCNDGTDTPQGRTRLTLQ